MHHQAYEFVAANAPRIAHTRVLEVGSLDINGSVRPLFGAAERYWGLDLVAGPGVDEVADAAHWSPGDDRYDVVVCCEVLEHAPAWEAVLGTCWGALEPGGTLLMTCACDPRPPHSAVDGMDVRDGEHYRNVGAADVVALVRSWGCTDWSVEAHLDRGDCYLRARRPH